MSDNSPALRIFSYIPNPRVFKATIAGRMCGVSVEWRGDRPAALADWLWDFDARPLAEAPHEAAAANARQSRVGFRGTLVKTEAFLDAHPFGTVPAAWSADGSVGIFESNSILRSVARLGRPDAGLYGSDGYEASRIDSFLDVSLLFARETQIYLLAAGGDALSAQQSQDAERAYVTYLAGIDRALRDRSFLVGDRISIADIAFVCELLLCHVELPRKKNLEEKRLPCILAKLAESGDFPRAFAHFDALTSHPAFAPDCIPYLEKMKAA